MRKKLLVGNWKMNKNVLEAKEFVLNAKEIFEFAFANELEIGIAPTYLCLETVKNNALKKLLVLSQNVHCEDKGAFTGEVSAKMLKSINVDGSIIGHSERRMYDNETSLKCNKKIKVLLDNELMPIYCVGENQQEFDDNLTKEVIGKQIQEGLKDLKEEELSRVVIAYEPIWSIGTGKNASCEIAQDVCNFIRNQVAKLSYNASLQVRILYGGSVNPNNIKNYLFQNDIDGALVGGASLQVESFSKMVHALID